MQICKILTKLDRCATHYLKTFQQSTADNVNLPELCFLIKS